MFAIDTRWFDTNVNEIYVIHSIYNMPTMKLEEVYTTVRISLFLKSKTLFNIFIGVLH